MLQSIGAMLRGRKCIFGCLAIGSIVSISAQDVLAADARAQFELARQYELGRGQEQDLPRAAQLYQQSTQSRYAPAMTALGYLYQTGSGVPRDFRKAAKLYEEAAAAGDVGGAFLLGVAYINGTGVARNGTEAANWLYEAAAKGHQQAQFMLGVMLAEGSVISRNQFAARRWLDRAAQGPDRKMASAAARMVRELDDRLLFSGAFRQADVAVVAAIGFGLLALMAASGDHSPLPAAAEPYDPTDYDPCVAAHLAQTSCWELIE